MPISLPFSDKAEHPQESTNTAIHLLSNQHSLSQQTAQMQTHKKYGKHIHKGISSFPAIMLSDRRMRMSKGHRHGQALTGSDNDTLHLVQREPHVQHLWDANSKLMNIIKAGT
jgi:hypothetical protein